MPSLGCLPRPFDPKEVKYRFATPPLTAINFNEPADLRPWLTKVEDQQTIGSCVAQAGTSALELLAQKRGITPPELNRLWLYWHGRIKSGLVDQSGRPSGDTGMFIAPALDLALSGVPREELFPYVPDATLQPPASLDADAPNQDYALAHRPIYATDEGGFEGGVVAALHAGMPVLVGMWWAAQNVKEANDMLSVIAPASGQGGHCVLIVAYQPASQSPTGKRRYYCRNSWGEGWDFWLSEEHFAPNGPVFELRAVDAERAGPQPDVLPSVDAVQIADEVIKGFSVKAWSRPRSVFAYRAQGATAVRDALRAALGGDA